MRKIYSYITLALLTSASLSSCSRTDYAFKPNTSPYHGIQQSVSVAPARTAENAATEVTSSSTAIAETAVTPVSPAAIVAPVRKAKLHAKPTAVAPKLTLTTVPKKVVDKLVRTVDKQLDKHQDAAAVNQPASKAGRAAIVGGVGLLLLLLGGAAEIGIIALIGLIAFLVGAIMLVIALINGD
jgi:hypothetical protein